MSVGDEVKDNIDWRRHCLAAEERLKEYQLTFDGMTPSEARRLRSLEAVVERFATAQARNPVVGILLREGAAFSGHLRQLFRDTWETKEST